MKRDVLDRFFQDTKGITGWFSLHDAAVFELLLSLQFEKNIHGDLLEIGVFEGKSAILIGRHKESDEEFHVCDIFDNLTDLKNMEENLSSYPNLSRGKFEANFRTLLGVLPDIHQCPSSELRTLLGDRKFRFIHVDGSHLYEHVKGDLELALQIINEDQGIIAVDDFRSQHTIGVTVALWQIILAGQLVPIVMTPAKMYLTKTGANVDLNRVIEELESAGIQCVTEEILGMEVVRTVGLADKDLYVGRRGISAFIPPVLTDLIRNSYLWKKLRSR